MAQEKPLQPTTRRRDRRTRLLWDLLSPTRKLMRDALSEGWSLKPGDALHLATADHLKVGAFHTYDEGLDKYEKITETHFKICRPIATQPVIVMPAVAEPEKPKDSSGQTTEGA